MSLDLGLNKAAIQELFIYRQVRHTLLDIYVMYSTQLLKSLAVAVDLVFTHRFGCWDVDQITRVWKTAI